jgi:hypothetical protein
MNIEWNKVTWYSKVVAVILFVAVFYTGYYLGKQNEKLERGIDPIIPSSVAPVYTERCFTRMQASTPKAPYEVTEYVKIEYSSRSTKVTGTKRGSQKGPDMMNGYEGTLEGTKNGSTLTLLYDYTIEGSKNKEIELYELSADSLTKMRYPLKELNGVLNPDSSGQPQKLVYNQVSCS